MKDTQIYGYPARLVFSDDHGEFEIDRPFKLVDCGVRLDMDRIADAIQNREAQILRVRPVY